MYPKTDFKTDFPKPGITYPGGMKTNFQVNAIGVAYARGEKSRSQKLSIKLFQEQLKARHKINAVETPDAWITATSWAAVFAVWTNRPAAAERLVKAALRLAQPETSTEFILKQQSQALAELQARQSREETPILPARPPNLQPAGC